MSLKFNCPFIVSTGLVSILTVTEMYFSYTEEFIYKQEYKTVPCKEVVVFLNNIPFARYKKASFANILKNVLRRLSVKNTLIFSILLKECFV